MEEEKSQNFEVEETPTQPIEQPSENTTIEEFKLPSWWLNFSDSCSRLSKRLQRSFDRLLFALDEEQKEKLKKNLYYLVCFIGFVGYAIFQIVVLAIWLFVDFIIALTSFNITKEDSSTNFVIKGIVMFLIILKQALAFILRFIGWGNFDFSGNGVVVKIVKNMFFELRPSQMTFRFGVLTLIIAGYITGTIAIVNLQTFAINTQENALDFASGLRFPSAYEKIKNSDYQLAVYPDSKNYKLKDGQYLNQEPKESIEISKISFGDINKDGKDDAVVALDLNTGGTLNWTVLTAMLDYNGSPQQTNTIDIGFVQKMFIYDQKIIAKMLEYAPSDPNCCRSLKVKRTYHYNSQGLEELLTDSNQNNQQPSQYEGDYYEGY
jgi:hypothetical protein